MVPPDTYTRPHSGQIEVCKETVADTSSLLSLLPSAMALATCSCSWDITFAAEFSGLICPGALKETFASLEPSTYFRLAHV